jgi:hypothetical protein
MLDTRIRLRREVDLPFGQGSGVHLMEPRLVYTGVTSASQSDNPLFIPRPRTLQERIRQFELFNVTRDPSDRIDSVNAITAGLGNRFYVPREEGEPPELFADVSLSTQYEFGDSDLGNFYLEGTVFPYERVQVRFNMGYDLEETEFSEGLLEARYFSEKGHDLAFSYRYLRDIPRFFASSSPSRTKRTATKSSRRASRGSTRSPSGGGCPSPGTGPSATAFATPSRTASC